MALSQPHNADNVETYAGYKLPLQVKNFRGLNLPQNRDI